MLFFCVGICLFSRAASRRVSSAQASLTSVFGMGTGGPSPQSTPTVGGRGWIRTIEAESSRFTVCPLWPLGNSPILNSLLKSTNQKWSWWTDLNPRPADYKSAALPTELHQHIGGETACILYQANRLLSIPYTKFLWSRRQDLNLRHLGPKPSTLPN